MTDEEYKLFNAGYRLAQHKMLGIPYRMPWRIDNATRMIEVPENIFDMPGNPRDHIQHKVAA